MPSVPSVRNHLCILENTPFWERRNLPFAQSTQRTQRGEPNWEHRILVRHAFSGNAGLRGSSRGNQRADFGSPRSLAILMKPREQPSQKRIAPSRKEGALTPRYSCGSSRGNQRADFGSPRSLAIPRLGTPNFSLACLLRFHFSPYSPCPLCSLCEPCFSRPAQMRIAPSREKRALTPRCLLSPCPLCSLCETILHLFSAYMPYQLKNRLSQKAFLRALCVLCANPVFSRHVQNRIAPSRKEKALTP